MRALLLPLQWLVEFVASVGKGARFFVHLC